MIDYYEILGLKKNANSQEIRTAYKNMALKYHPDRNKNGEEQFKKVSEAYQILSDDNLRKKYDLNQDINLSYKNPLDIWKSFFPNDISDELLNIILKSIMVKISDDFSFDHLYKLFLEKFNNLGNNHKSTTKNIFIDVRYDIEDHFQLDFMKKVYVEMETNAILKKFTYNIDTRKDKYLFTENYYTGGNKKDFIKININLNVNPNHIPEYNLIDKKNLLYTLKISYLNYTSGFYLKHNLFGKVYVIHFDKPIKSNLLYLIPDKGIPISKDSSGDLYFKLIIDDKSHIYHKPSKNEKVIYAKEIKFF